MSNYSERGSFPDHNRKPFAPKNAEQAENLMLKHVPPHSVTAEQAVLAGIFQSQSTFNIIVDTLTKDDFYLPAHQMIYATMLHLYQTSKPIDVVTCAERLKDQNQLEAVGGTVYMGEIMQAVVAGANAPHYANIVRDKSLQRRLIETCSGIIGNCYDSTQEVKELLDTSQQSIFAIAQRSANKELFSTKDIIDNVFQKLSDLAASHEQVTGVTTGFSQLDRMTAGLQPSDLIIIAARPSMGKTAFAMCLALNAAINKNTSVAVYSLEMSKEQLLQRMLAVQAKVDVSLLRQPGRLKDEDWSKLFNAADAIGQAPIFIDDTPSLSTLELRARTRRLMSEHGVGMVIVDYLQLMRAGRRIDSRELEISEISRSLKALAKELNVPVVALSQLNRKVEERADKRPMLSDLRESGAIEQDSDVIMFVYREDVYTYTKPSERPPQGVAEIIIGKQRNGPVGAANLMYLSRYTAFVDMAPDYMVAPSE